MSTAAKYFGAFGAGFPKGEMSFAEAAAVPSVALTAWQALVDKASVQAGQMVLIQGASGGIGMFAIPIAKLRGAKVFATASIANQDFLKQLGADVAIDYKTQKFEDIAKNVDVVVDGVGGETLKGSYPVVKKGGKPCLHKTRMTCFAVQTGKRSLT